MSPSTPSLLALPGSWQTFSAAPPGSWRMARRAIRNPLLQAGDVRRLAVLCASMLAIAILAPRLLSALWPSLTPRTPLLNWLLLLLLALPVLPLARDVLRDPATFGWTWAGGRRSALEGLLWGLLTVLLVGTAITVASSQGIRWTWRDSLLVYPLHVLIQEFVGRGLIQVYLERTLNDRSGRSSVLIGAALFGLAHSMHGWGAVALTGLAGIAFGALYRRHRNLVGTSVLHTVLGLAAFASGVL